MAKFYIVTIFNNCKFRSPTFFRCIIIICIESQNSTVPICICIHSLSVEVNFERLIFCNDDFNRIIAIHIVTIKCTDFAFNNIACGLQHFTSICTYKYIATLFNGIRLVVAIVCAFDGYSAGAKRISACIYGCAIF